MKKVILITISLFSLVNANIDKPELTFKEKIYKHRGKILTLMSVVSLGSLGCWYENRLRSLKARNGKLLNDLKDAENVRLTLIEGYKARMI